MIPYGRQNISDADIQAVIDVMKSDFITQGPAIERFEKSVADYCGVKYAVAVSNATAALHIACMAAGLGNDDWLWTSPNTFVASANCGLYCGGRVDFVDIDRDTFNMSVTELARKLEKAKANGRLPKVVIPVHFAGQSCDMKVVHELAKQYGFKVIEDASHAIGGHYDDQPIGSCRYSDMAVFSFHPVKIVTTGEGGMVLTNREDLYQQLIRLRSHGITRDPRFMEGEPYGPWDYQQIELGYNYRMTDMQAALGWSQMSRLDAFVAKRRLLAGRYRELLADLPVTCQQPQMDGESAWHLYVIRLNLEKIAPLTHRMVFEGLRAAGIGVNLHYIPVHTQPYYRNLGFQGGDFPQAEQYYREAISLPMYYDLTDAQQEFVVKTLGQLLASTQCTV